MLQTFYDSLRQVCRNTRDCKHSTAFMNVAESAGYTLMNWSKNESFGWHNLHLQLGFLLSNKLPPEEAK